jgi:hypothetical protein
VKPTIPTISAPACATRPLSARVGVGSASERNSSSIAFATGIITNGVGVSTAFAV